MAILPQNPLGKLFQRKPLVATPPQAMRLSGQIPNPFGQEPLMDFDIGIQDAPTEGKLRLKARITTPVRLPLPPPAARQQLGGPAERRLALRELLPAAQRLAKNLKQNNALRQALSQPAVGHLSALFDFELTDPERLLPQRLQANRPGKAQDRTFTPAPNHTTAPDSGINAKVDFVFTPAEPAPHS